MFNDAYRSGLVTANPFAALGLKQGRGRRDLPSEWLTAADVDRWPRSRAARSRTTTARSSRR
jgi:hypothetical protein